MNQPLQTSPDQEPRRSNRIAGTAAVIWLLLPSVVVAAGASDADSIRMGIIRWFVAILFFVVALGLVRPITGRLARAALLTVLGLYCTVCLVLAAYRVRAHIPLDVGFVLASPGDSIRTFLILIGYRGTALTLLFLGVTVWLFAVALRSLTPTSFPWRKGALLTVVLLAAMLYSGGMHAGLIPDYATISIGHDTLLPPLILNYRPFEVSGATDNVMILQLESVNAIAMGGERVVEGKAYNDNYTPGTDALRPRGVYFPFFWASDIVTHRAQQAILCGAIRNFSKSYVDQQAPRTTPCVPELFKAAGYRTIFISSYQDGTFYDTSGFMTRIGFDERHFADVMHPEDPTLVWGYPESLFYKRTFDFLRKRFGPNEKLFVYVAVCANHAGFARDATRDAAFFDEPISAQLAQFLWSAKIQDRSLIDFEAEYRDFAKWKPTHLFIIPDHGFPLGMYGRSEPQNGVSIDNFLTTCLYIPPESRAGEFALGRSMTEIYGQSDLMPTIAELVTHRPRQNSLVPFMRVKEPENPPYEPCQVMTQPYGGGFIYIARGSDAYVYSRYARTITKFRILRHPMRQVQVGEVQQDVSDAHFEAQYGCRRYHRRETE